MSQTPRTDAERLRFLTASINYDEKFDAAIEWARHLEQELNDLMAWQEKAFKAHPNLDLDIANLG